MIWSYQLNKSQYLELFQEHNKLCTLRPVQKYWYKDRFEWRLGFWFRTDQKRSSLHSVEWVDLLNHLRKEGYRYRFRSESYNCLFVNNTEILDFILNSNYVNFCTRSLRTRWFIARLIVLEIHSQNTWSQTATLK